MNPVVLNLILLYGGGRLIDTFAHGELLKFIWGGITAGGLICITVLLDVSYTVLAAVGLAIISLLIW